MKLVKKNGIDVLEIQGEIVFESSNDIKHRAKEILEEGDLKKVVIDLQNVPFIDSSGVGVLISLFKHQAEKEGEIVLAAPTKKVSRVLELTRMDKILDIHDTVEAAVGEV
ncbi:MAG: STAS domain-containing protein [Clostridia bacterium]|nr:STAS domain-containing protein [Clostridia bacterium]